MRTVLSAAVFLCCAGLAGGAPPTLDFPPENRPVNGYVVVEPKTDAVSITYVALDGVYAFPSKLLSDQRTFALPASGLKDGTYRWMAVAAGKGGEQTSKLLVVTIGQGGPVVIDPPKKDDPVVPPPTPADKFYFLVVRADGPASAEFTKAMTLPAWQQLRAAGHKVAQVTATQAADPSIGAVVPPAQLPAVVTLVVSADKKESRVVRPAVPLPATDAGVLKLAEVK
jgi:hypothetical protein